MSNNDSRYLRRAPANLEETVKVPQSLSPSLPYWDSEVFVFKANTDEDELCPVDPESAGNENQQNQNFTTWKELGLGVLAGLIVSKLLR
jgi:hypothetical protein